MFPGRDEVNGKEQTKVHGSELAVVKERRPFREKRQGIKFMSLDYETRSKSLVVMYI